MIHLPNTLTIYCPCWKNHLQTVQKTQKEQSDKQPASCEAQHYISTEKKGQEQKSQIKCKSKVWWYSKAAVWSRLMRLSKCAHWRKRLLLARAIHVFLECMAQPMDDICLIHGITMETVRSNHSFVEDDSQRSAPCQWHLWIEPILSVAAGNTDWAKCVVQSRTSDVRTREPVHFFINRFASRT